MSTKKSLVYAKLILLTKNDDTGPIFQVKRTVINIGSGNDPNVKTHIKIKVPGIDDTHAFIKIDSEGWAYLQCKNTSGNVQLEGSSITDSDKRKLQHLDIISFAGRRLRFEYPSGKPCLADAAATQQMAPISATQPAPTTTASTSTPLWSQIPSTPAAVELITTSASQPTPTTAPRPVSTIITPPKKFSLSTKKNLSSTTLETASSRAQTAPQPTLLPPVALAVEKPNSDPPGQLDSPRPVKKSVARSLFPNDAADEPKTLSTSSDGPQDNQTAQKKLHATSKTSKSVSFNLAGAEGKRNDVIAAVSAAITDEKKASKPNSSATRKSKRTQATSSSDTEAKIAANASDADRLNQSEGSAKKSKPTSDWIKLDGPARELRALSSSFHGFREHEIKATIQQATIQGPSAARRSKTAAIVYGGKDNLEKHYPALFSRTMSNESLKDAAASKKKSTTKSKRQPEPDPVDVEDAPKSTKSAKKRKRLESTDSESDTKDIQPARKKKATPPEKTRQSARIKREPEPEPEPITDDIQESISLPPHQESSDRMEVDSMPSVADTSNVVESKVAAAPDSEHESIDDLGDGDGDGDEYPYGDMMSTQLPDTDPDPVRGAVLAMDSDDEDDLPPATQAPAADDEMPATQAPSVAKWQFYEAMEQCDSDLEKEDEELLKDTEDTLSTLPQQLPTEPAEPSDRTLLSPSKRRAYRVIQDEQENEEPVAEKTSSGLPDTPAPQQQTPFPDTLPAASLDDLDIVPTCDLPTPRAPTPPRPRERLSEASLNSDDMEVDAVMQHNSQLEAAPSDEPTPAADVDAQPAVEVAVLPKPETSQPMSDIIVPATQSLPMEVIDERSPDIREPLLSPSPLNPGNNVKHDQPSQADLQSSFVEPDVSQSQPAQQQSQTDECPRPEVVPIKHPQLSVVICEGNFASSPQSSPSSSRPSSPVEAPLKPRSPSFGSSPPRFSPLPPKHQRGYGVVPSPSTTKIATGATLPPIVKKQSLASRSPAHHTVLPAISRRPAPYSPRKPPVHVARASISQNDDIQDPDTQGGEKPSSFRDEIVSSQPASQEILNRSNQSAGSLEEIESPSPISAVPSDNAEEADELSAHSQQSQGEILLVGMSRPVASHSQPINCVPTRDTETSASCPGLMETDSCNSQGAIDIMDDDCVNSDS